MEEEGGGGGGVSGSHGATVDLFIYHAASRTGADSSREIKHNQKYANWKVKPEDAAGGLMENTGRIHVVREETLALSLSLSLRSFMYYFHTDTNSCFNRPFRARG